MSFDNKKILITQSDAYMGPTISELLTSTGANVIAKPGIVPYEDNAFDEWASDVGEPDVIFANLAHDPSSTPIENIDTATWEALYGTMVHPLMAIVRRFAPSMAERGGGKIVAITSAAPLRGIPGSAA
ncbi:MAG: SDR family NAD(P)-dependent oxidoreductase [Gammaproteobacteria bacterium]|nr:SDR family NAD(P)-dependent oxidoreductase [Gammaproteobacteria bacterium]